MLLQWDLRWDLFSIQDEQVTGIPALFSLQHQEYQEYQDRMRLN